MLVGKVLWWDERDGFGIIVDEHENEYYVDSSILRELSEEMKGGVEVTFDRDDSAGIVCACNVDLAS